MKPDTSTTMVWADYCYSITWTSSLTGKTITLTYDVQREARRQLFRELNRSR